MDPNRVRVLSKTWLSYTEITKKPFMCVCVCVCVCVYNTPSSHHYHRLTVSPTRMVVASLKHSLSPTLTASLLLNHSSSMHFHVHLVVDAKPTFLPLWCVTAHCKTVRVKFPRFAKPMSTSSGSFPNFLFLLILTWFLFRVGPIHFSPKARTKNGALFILIY